MAGILRWTYPPIMLVGFNGAAMALIGAGAAHVLLAPLLAGAIALSFAVERAIPYRGDWNEPRGDVARDVAHAAVNETCALLSVLALPAVVSIATAWDVWPHPAPFAVQVLLAIVVFDFGITIAHWLSHRWGPLWRLHSVHHSLTRCYGFNGLMKHPLHQAVELGFGIAPLLLVGIPQDVAWALAFAVAIQLLMQHSNADYRIGPLRFVLALNEGHRFHHLKWAGVGDVNFGLFTLIYDHLLLRTFSFDAHRRFSSDDLGIATQPAFPTGYVDQLLEPVRWRSGAERS
jgi:sterol desaturase/sphingolipid hydroxylase (fatty acid hydroxylase superfamily)